VLSPFLADPNQEVAETAAAALGILAEERAAQLLAELVLDTPAGRRAVRASEVSARTRAFAAYALGLAGHRSSNEDVRRFAVHKLSTALLDEDEATADLGVACVLALGRLPLPWSGAEPAEERGTAISASASREAQVRFLLEVLEARKTERLVRAHVPTALGLVAAAPDPSLPAGTSSDDPGVRASMRATKELVAEACLKALAKTSCDPLELRQSAAIALGVVGDNDNDGVDRRIRAALMEVEDGEASLRRLAWMALAQAGGRAGEGAPVGVPDVRSFLLKKVARASGENANWGALSLAVFERGLTEGGRALDADSAHALRRRLEDASSPSDVGAAAIACGIVGDPEAGEPLLEALKRVADEEAQGEVAIALGLLRADGALERIRRQVDEATYRPKLMRDSALALGLHGDRGAVKLLLGKLERASALPAQAAIAQALGRIGDRTTCEPLIEMLGNRQLTDSARSFAAVALGLVADRDELPWNTVLSVETNYLAPTPTLYDQQGFGILNIL
jgi:HEAT repeat protein